MDNRTFPLFPGYATVNVMKNLTNTQGSVWMAILVIVAVVVAALLLSSNSNLTTKSNSVHGLVTEINQEGRYFLLTEIEVLSVAENGDAEIRETEYLVLWTNEKSIEPYHPSVLNGGEMVRVTPREQLEEGEILIVDPKSIEITRGAEEGAETSEEETTPAATTTTAE